MATELKERVVVSDSSTSFEVWTKQEYETYIKDCTDAGAAPAYWIITQFNEDEKLLSPSTPLSVGEAAKEAKKKATAYTHDCHSIINFGFNGSTGQNEEATHYYNGFLAGAAHREKQDDFLPVLEENFKAQIEGKKMNDPEIWGGYDCFSAVIETYEDLISIYKRGSWGKNSQPSSTPIPSDIVEQLEDLDPYVKYITNPDGTLVRREGSFDYCISKLRELLSSQPSQGSVQGLIAALTEITQQPGEWNECKQVARKALADYKYPGMTNVIKAQSGNHE